MLNLGEWIYESALLSDQAPVDLVLRTERAV